MAGSRVLGLVMWWIVPLACVWMAYVVAVGRMEMIHEERALSKVLEVGFKTGKYDQGLSPEQVERFQRDGFLIVRGLIPSQIVSILNEQRPKYSFPLWLRPMEWYYQYMAGAQVSYDQIWREKRVFREFWFGGDLGNVLSSIFDGQSVRLLTDIIYGFPRGVRPTFLGQWHKDTASFDNINSLAQTSNRKSKAGNATKSLGVSAWIPLNGIDADNQGGSLMLGNFSMVKRECQDVTDSIPSEDCKAHLDEIAQVFSFELGDVLFFTDHTFHRSQPILENAPLVGRFSLVGRFTNATARYVNPEGGPIVDQRKNYCNHNLADNDIIDTPCYPKIFPVDPEELRLAESKTIPSRTYHIIRTIGKILSNFEGKEL